MCSYNLITTNEYNDIDNNKCIDCVSNKFLMCVICSFIILVLVCLIIFSYPIGKFVSENNNFDISTTDTTKYVVIGSFIIILLIFSPIGMLLIISIPILLFASLLYCIVIIIELLAIKIKHYLKMLENYQKKFLICLKKSVLK